MSMVYITSTDIAYGHFFRLSILSHMNIDCLEGCGVHCITDVILPKYMLAVHGIHCFCVAYVHLALSDRLPIHKY